MGRDFTLEKEWTVQNPDPLYYLDGVKLDGDATARAKVFLRLISFRYIPNRVVPTEVIRGEADALLETLNRRLSRKKAQQKEVLDSIATAARTLTAELSAEVCGQVAEIDDVQLATPKSLGELAFSFGYRVSEGGVQMEDTEQGSGVQSLLMFQTLRLIDLDRFQQFGWQQAAIWAVEEPESSQHMALEVQIARFLQRGAQEDKRLQVLATTHSDVMMQYADAGYLAEKMLAGTTIRRAANIQEMLQESARFGISRWVNPILRYPLEPVVLVEGKSDRDLILAGFEAFGLRSRAKIVCLADLTGNEDDGGVNRIKDFLKEMAAAIRTRDIAAPVVLVLDWDASTQQDAFSRILNDPDRLKVLAWDASEANPQLHESLRGVERFLSTEWLERVDSAGPSVIATKQDGTKTIHNNEYGKLKKVVAAEIASGGMNSADLKFCEPFLNRLVGLVS